MNKKIFILPLVAVSTFLALTGCDNNKRKGNELYITVYDGGYGTEWIDQVSKDYEAKTGIKVNWTADQSILDRMDSELDSPQSDIYMSHDIRWQEYAEAELLEPLDDLYDSEVEGTGKTFKQRLCGGAEEVSKLNGHYYKVCYTQGAGGLVYNKTMFEENNLEVPTTYDELYSLCQTIIDAHIEGDDPGSYVKPIGWSGADREYYWDYIVFEWWAQLGGKGVIDDFKAYLGNDGRYSTGYQVYDPSDNHKEFVQAYQKWYDLIVGHPSFSISKPQDEKLFQVNSKFASGQLAMIPYAQWAKYEIQQNSGIELDFDIAMMKTPKVSATADDYNFNVGFGDSMIIPADIPDASKEMAKDFLRYLAGKEACKTFVDKARGAFLAFDYSIVDLGDLLNDSYIKSVYEKLTESTQVNICSTNPVAYINSASIMPWIGNNYYYSKAFAAPTNNSYKAEAVGAAIYQTAQNGWASWVRKAGFGAND